MKKVTKEQYEQVVKNYGHHQQVSGISEPPMTFIFNLDGDIIAKKQECNIRQIYTYWVEDDLII